MAFFTFCVAEGDLPRSGAGLDFFAGPGHLYCDVYLAVPNASPKFSISG